EWAAADSEKLAGVVEESLQSGSDAADLASFCFFVKGFLGEVREKVIKAVGAGMPGHTARKLYADLLVAYSRWRVSASGLSRMLAAHGDGETAARLQEAEEEVSGWHARAEQFAAALTPPPLEGLLARKRAFEATHPPTGKSRPIAEVLGDLRTRQE